MLTIMYHFILLHIFLKCSIIIKYCKEFIKVVSDLIEREQVGNISPRLKKKTVLNLI